MIICQSWQRCVVKAACQHSTQRNTRSPTHTHVHFLCPCVWWPDVVVQVGLWGCIIHLTHLRHHVVLLSHNLPHQPKVTPSAAIFLTTAPPLHSTPRHTTTPPPTTATTQLHSNTNLPRHSRVFGPLQIDERPDAHPNTNVVPLVATVSLRRDRQPTTPPAAAAVVAATMVVPRRP